jgi:quinohemoprotein ethanol dehydrogenase
MSTQPFAQRLLRLVLPATLLFSSVQTGLFAQENASGAAASNAILLDKAGGADWAGYGRTYGEQHYSPLADINATNIDRLKLAWFHDLPVGPSTTAPVEVDGVIYYARGYSVVDAVDALSGKLLWTYDPKVPEAAGQKLRTNWGSRGIAWWNGKVYTGTADGRLIAINAKTGVPVWSVMTIGKDDQRYITGAPRVFEGKVAIGHGGADFGAVRGYVTTYDAETGQQLWRFYTVPGDPAKGFENKAMAMAAKTWSGEWWKYGGGGTVWNAMTYDPETDTLLIGTGNGAPWNHRVRSKGKGDNLFLCSIIALDAKTGEYKWHYQINPAESWDYNAAMDIELADLTIDGKVRKVAMTAPKNGFYYVIDRLTGKLISAEPFAKVTWATKIDLTTGRPVEDPRVRYPDGTTFVMRPSPMGAHNWYPMAYSPKAGLTFIPTIDLAATFNDKGIMPESWKRAPGVNLDNAMTMGWVIDGSIPDSGTSSLLAWNPVTQKEVWRIPTPAVVNGGVLATAGDLVFQGQVDGLFNAYEAASGKRLWSFDAQDAVLAPPISYQVNGKQYLTVLTGYGTTGAIFGPLVTKYNLDYRSQKRRVLTFAVDGAAALPAVVAEEKKPPLQDASFHADAASAGRGEPIYGGKCSICHGLDAVAGGNAPDLRKSPVPLDADAFAAVVRDGSLISAGMPGFSELTDKEREDLRQFIRTKRQDSMF